ATGFSRVRGNSFRTGSFAMSLSSGRRALRTTERDRAFEVSVVGSDREFLEKTEMGSVAVKFLLEAGHEVFLRSASARRDPIRLPACAQSDGPFAHGFERDMGSGSVDGASHFLENLFHEPNDRFEMRVDRYMEKDGQLRLLGIEAMDDLSRGE